jgi:uncharacterized OB-fold protein
MTGTVYTETVVHLAPDAFAKDVPYQVVIVTLEDGTRITGRMAGDRVSIGDLVERVAVRDEVPFFQKAAFQLK